MKRTAKIAAIPTNMPTRNGRIKSHYRITLYINDQFLVDYTRSSRETARQIARTYRQTGICPTH